MNLDPASRELKNNFDVLRLAAATLVLISHSFVVVGVGEPYVGHFPLGTLGVEIFFAISGFLVAKSWFAQPRLRAFAVKRGLRILPALAVLTVGLALVLGPAVTHGSIGSYFHSSATYGYPVDNVAATASGGTVRSVSLHLPGVFASNPDTSVDKSLWTLPIEVRAYIALAIVGAIGLLTGGLPLLAIGFFALSVAPDSIITTPVIGSGLNFLRGSGGEAAHLLAIFFFAGLLYRHRARISLRTDLAVVALAALVASIGTPLERPVLVVAIPYLSLFLAYRSWGGFRTVARYGDVSYGLYLLAFPVQQLIVREWGGSSLPAPMVVAAIAFPVTYALAFASWHGVEKRALRLKGALAGPRARRPKVAEAAPSPTAAAAPAQL
jgi:peptidoglycan/LPS O-acetylase OafA/YrhL